MYNTYLYDQNRRSIFNVFCTGLKKKRVGIAGDTAVPLGLRAFLRSFIHMGPEPTN